MIDQLTLSVVNMQPISGQKQQNLAKMTALIGEAAAAGAKLVLLPELCLQGYDYYADPAIPLADKLHEAEAAGGESCRAVAALAQRYGMWVIFGMAERPYADQTLLYNTAAVAGPDGSISCYRKIHPFGEENLLFAKGDRPLLFHTAWGPVGVGICYDSYQFPELMRYYAWKGARLYLNPTAMYEEVDKPGSREAFLRYYCPTLEYGVLANTIFVASANLTGQDTLHTYGGGSMVIGPKPTVFMETDVQCWGGDPNCTAEGVYTATVDLSLATRRLCTPNPCNNEPDFRPALYAALYGE